MEYTSEIRQLAAHWLFEPGEALRLARLRRAMQRGERHEWLSKEEVRQLLFLKWRYEHGEFAKEGN